MHVSVNCQQQHINCAELLQELYPSGYNTLPCTASSRVKPEVGKDGIEEIMGLLWECLSCPIYFSKYYSCTTLPKHLFQAPKAVEEYASTNIKDVVCLPFSVENVASTKQK